jgi:hypothetical protein
MKNNELNKLVKEILSTPNITVEVGTVGGASIEVFIKTPYEDKGSIIYKNKQDRDSDFAELQTVLKNAKQTENVG